MHTGLLISVIFMYDLNSVSLSEGSGKERRRRSVYLEGAQRFYHTARGDPNRVTQVAPFRPNGSAVPTKAFLDHQRPSRGSLFDSLRPIVLLMRLAGVLPVGDAGGIFQVTAQMMAYSVAVFLVVLAYIGYVKWDKVEMFRSAEGRFEEAVIDYLFTVYLVPIVINPIAWYESRKQARVLTTMMSFEKIYRRVAKKNLLVSLGNAPLLIAIGLPVLAISAMMVTHVTMVHFKFFQVIPYCYINTTTYLIGGSWYVYCNLIGHVAQTIADDFQQALKNIGPSSRIADYRALWMMLAKLVRDVGDAFAYAVTFLCLYLFLIITLTIYGLLSRIQDGVGVKDVGLTLTAFLSGMMLFFVCDEAHYASNCVKVQFQKKLLLVELNWMNDDAQQEINMFLRATEMNPTDMSLGGFFDVNRNLFKSLIATMVTYLVVLLQFQISIPGDSSFEDGNVTMTNVTRVN